MTEHHTEARLWADHHQDWSRFATNLWHGAGEAFRVLTAIQFAAPWKTDASEHRSH